jgi:signal transduction histidine kinase
VTRIDGLLRNLIDAAALDTGSLQLSTSVVEVRGLVDDAVLLFEPLAEQKSVRLLVDASTSASVVCDRERILQVLENMIGNSLKFVPSGGVIAITAREQAAEMLFEVRDSGPGIAPEHVDRIFDRHWKSGAAAGTGLGLYIAKAIIDAHRGHIWARGGTGTTVAFTLPRTGRRLPDEAVRSPNGSKHAPFTSPNVSRKNHA